MTEEVPLTWRWRVLIVVMAVFFLPSLSMGTVSPVVAKLAVDRLRQSKRTGTAIGQVYAWGMVGSILGTFLTGFVLIDVLGTKGVLLVLAAVLAFAATVLGSIWHAAWAGIPLGLCVIAFLPDLCHAIANPKTEKGAGYYVRAPALIWRTRRSIGASARKAASPTPKRTPKPGSTRATIITSRSRTNPTPKARSGPWCSTT